MAFLGLFVPMEYGMLLTVKVDGGTILQINDLISNLDWSNNDYTRLDRKLNWKGVETDGKEKLPGAGYVRSFGA